MNEYLINGQKVSVEQGREVCQCGHNQLAHIHFNGGLNVPDGTPTYCGFQGCMCGKFQARNYPTIETEKTQLKRKFERILNLFALIESGLPYGFTEEFKASVKDAYDYCKENNENEQN